MEKRIVRNEEAVIEKKSGGIRGRTVVSRIIWFSPPNFFDADRSGASSSKIFGSSEEFEIFLSIDVLGVAVHISTVEVLIILEDFPVERQIIVRIISILTLANPLLLVFEGIEASLDGLLLVPAHHVHHCTCIGHRIVLGN